MRDRRRGMRGAEVGGLSRVETRLEARPSGNHPGTTCANYFAKQSLAVVASPLLPRVVRPLRYWFDRVVTMSRDNASYSDLSVGCRDTLGGRPCPRGHGGLLIQLFRPGRKCSGLAVPPKLLSRRTCERRLCEKFVSHLSAPLYNMRHQICKCDDAARFTKHRTWRETRREKKNHLVGRETKNS